jgi:hypothetical protein
VRRVRDPEPLLDGQDLVVVVHHEPADPDQVVGIGRNLKQMKPEVGFKTGSGLQNRKWA